MQRPVTRPRSPEATGAEENEPASTLRKCHKSDRSNRAGAERVCGLWSGSAAGRGREGLPEAAARTLRFRGTTIRPAPPASGQSVTAKLNRAAAVAQPPHTPRGSTRYKTTTEPCVGCSAWLHAPGLPKPPRLKKTNQRSRLRNSTRATLPTEPVAMASWVFRQAAPLFEGGVLPEAAVGTRGFQGTTIRPAEPASGHV